MKAAVLHQLGDVPRYEDFPDPVAGDGEVVIEVTAVAVENVDKLVAAGRHYAAGRYTTRFPVIPGFDGVGTRPDGTLVGFADPTTPYGALAEKTVVPDGNLTPVPDGLDPVDLVALGSAMPGMCALSAGGLTAGETVLIQGATGVAGRLAVQVARLRGAGRIVVTGRDEDALRALGADAVITTEVPDDQLRQAFADTREEGYDVVVDFLWGRPTEILLRALTPDSFAFAKPTRLVQAGEAAGPAIALRADALRTSGVEISGSARGVDATAIAEGYQQVVRWARDGALTLAVETVPLSRIESAWQRTDLRGKRLVVLPRHNKEG